MCAQDHCLAGLTKLQPGSHFRPWLPRLINNWTVLLAYLTSDPTVLNLWQFLDTEPRMKFAPYAEPVCLSRVTRKAVGP